MPKKTPHTCPSCSGPLYVSELKCPECSTAVRGEYHPSPLGNLTEEQLEFARTFILSRGNIKEVESRLGISYPTVRNRLDELIRSISEQPANNKTPAEILDALEAGTITALQAAEMLKNIQRGE